MTEKKECITELTHILANIPQRLELLRDDVVVLRKIYEIEEYAEHVSLKKEAEDLQKLQVIFDCLKRKVLSRKSIGSPVPGTIIF